MILVNEVGARREADSVVSNAWLLSVGGDWFWTKTGSHFEFTCTLLSRVGNLPLTCTGCRVNSSLVKSE